MSDVLLFFRGIKIPLLIVFVCLCGKVNAEMYVGAAYYPEQLSETTVEEDAVMMREAGLNMVRMGDFAWSALEPADGEFRFDWLDHAVNRLWSEGIGTLLCTPTAAIPKWMHDSHPDIMQIQADGRRKPYGRRRHACYNNESYRNYCLRIVREMAERYKNHPAVIGFQIDNEMTTEEPYCYCEDCRKAFVEWLINKYVTVERLNSSWGTAFWSETLSSFDQVWLPRTMDNPAIYLDYQRFVSDRTLDFFHMQADEIKRIAPRMLCTTNVGGGGFINSIDLHRLGKECDILSVDNYPINCTVESLYGNNVGQPFDPAMVSFALQQIRGGRNERIWVTEEQVGRTALTQREIVPDEMVRLWTHQQVAYGCGMSLFFPFRAFKSAHEHLMTGVVESDGVKRSKYDEVSRAASEIRRLYAATGDLLPVARAAVVRDFDSDWAFENGYTFCPDLKYLREVYAYYKALRDSSVMADIVSPDSSLEQYDLIIIPYAALVDSAFARRVTKRAREGAVVILTCLSGVRDRDFHKFDGLVCKELRDIAGIEIDRQEALFGRKSNTMEFDGQTGVCRYWFDKVIPSGSRTLACFNGDYFSGHPAVTCNSAGKGKVFYVATVPEQKMLDSIVRMAVSESSVKPLAEKSDSLVDVAEMQDSEGNRYLYIVNFSDKEQPLSLAVRGRDVVTGEKYSKMVAVAPLDCRVLKLED